MSWLMSGTQALQEVDRIQEEREKQNQQKRHQRFYLKEGEQCEIIILDRSPDETFALYEHAIPLNGSWRDVVYEVSPKTIGEEDPLETNNLSVLNDKPSKPYFVRYYTILALQPYEREVNGVKQVVPYSRKLLPVKSNMIKKFNEYEQAAMKEFGTLRGVRFLMRRPTKAESSIGTASIGQPILISGASLMAHYKEDELLRNFGHPPIMANGKVAIPENGLLQPFQYADGVFQKPVQEDLRRRYRIGATFGSKEEVDAVWSNVASTDLNTSQPASQPQQAQESPALNNQTFDDVAFG